MQFMDGIVRSENDMKIILILNNPYEPPRFFARFENISKNIYLIFYVFSSVTMNCIAFLSSKWNRTACGYARFCFCSSVKMQEITVFKKNMYHVASAQIQPSCVFLFFFVFTSIVIHTYFYTALSQQYLFLAQPNRWPLWFPIYILELQAHKCAHNGLLMKAFFKRTTNNINNENSPK